MKSILTAVALATLLGSALMGCAPQEPTAQTDPAVTTAPGGAAQHPHDATGEGGLDAATAVGNIRTQIAASTDVSIFDISVEREGDTMILRGTVPTEAARMRAEEIARNAVDSARYPIVNELRIQPDVPR
jgi:hypothetical protein